MFLFSLIAPTIAPLQWSEAASTFTSLSSRRLGSFPSNVKRARLSLSWYVSAINSREESTPHSEIPYFCQKHKKDPQD